MKRSEILKLIANQLNFLNGTFDGLKDTFTPAELAKADVILTTLEDAGMQPPNITLNELLPDSGLIYIGEEKHWYACWEPETELDKEEFRQKNKLLVDKAISKITQSLEMSMGIESVKPMPSLLSEEELKEIYDNDEDLRNE